MRSRKRGRKKLEAMKILWVPIRSQESGKGLNRKTVSARTIK